MRKPLKFYFKNKRVLVTGHTGFKGSWLSTTLSYLGAKVYGISKNYPTNFYKNLYLKDIKSYIFDLKDLNKTKKTIIKIKPHYIFHLAAQSIVSKSYEEPIETWNSNLIGFLNILETIRQYNSSCSVVMITSDKCYFNVEKKSGYKETDRLGGYENYSASKASCEILFKSYFQSYFKKNKNINIATARAGNVIGGGDWSKNRLIPDIVRSLQKKKILTVRNLESTRPWQHVLEPIFGYIELASNLNFNPKLSGESFNFGPYNAKNYNVRKILSIFKKNFKHLRFKKHKKNFFKESGLLNLNCKKAFKSFKWKSKLNFSETIKHTIYWYKNYKKIGIKNITLQQIKEYEKMR